MRNIIVNFLWLCLTKVQGKKTKGQLISGLKVDLRTDDQREIDRVLRLKKGAKRKVADMVPQPLTYDYQRVGAVIRGEAKEPLVWPVAKQVADSIIQGKYN